MSESIDILKSYQQNDALSADILSRIDEDLRNAYWKEKNLRRVMELGKAGIDYAMQLADETSTDCEKFLQSAKTMAYNVASFAWPGWNEPEIVITEEDLKYGFICAKLNLRLAIELNRPAEKIADADWLIGAYRLAQSDWQGALDAFLMADAANSTQLIKGYILLAHRGLGDDSAEAEWENLLQQLKPGLEGDSSFIRTQLLTVSKVFLNR